MWINSNVGMGRRVADRRNGIQRPTNKISYLSSTDTPLFLCLRDNSCNLPKFMVYSKLKVEPPHALVGDSNCIGIL